MELKKEEVKNITEQQFRSSLPEVELVKVVVTPDEDWVGDEILNIIIVLDTKKKRQTLDSSKTIELRRRVRSRLVEKEDHRFPIIDFVLKSEAGQLGVGT